MTYKPIIIFFLFLFSLLPVKGQDKGVLKRNLVCASVPLAALDSLSVEGVNYKYFLFYIDRGLQEQDTTSFQGDGFVLLTALPNLEEKARKVLAIHMMKQYRLQSVMFFEKCDLVTLYYRALVLSEREKQMIKNGTANYYWKDLENP